MHQLRQLQTGDLDAEPHMLSVPPHIPALLGLLLPQQLVACCLLQVLAAEIVCQSAAAIFLRAGCWHGLLGGWIAAGACGVAVHAATLKLKPCPESHHPA